MINARSIVKQFDKKTVLDDVTITVAKGGVYGLVGSNGSGKSTMLRCIAGVYKPESGACEIGGKDVFENEEIKNSIRFVSDEPYFFGKYSMDSAAALYKKLYRGWSDETYDKLCETFPINRKARLSTFSKGMKRQASLILALASSPEYLLLDEAFDGLDPVMRNLLKRIIADGMLDRQMTTIITSHNLRELEDICGKVGILHGSKIIRELSLESAENEICKAQVAFEAPIDEALFAPVSPLKVTVTGRIATVIMRGGIKKVEEELKSLNPIFCEALPLTLEEIFLYEMGEKGYEAGEILE